MANDYFFATLNGQTYRDLYYKIISLDRSVTSFKDRVNNVKKLLGDNSYLVKYFSDYYDPHLSKMNHISTGNNICHLVEMLANYLLMTDEVKKIDGREKTYYIDSNRLNRLGDKPSDIKEQYGINNLMVVNFNKENYKKDKKVKIYKKDLTPNTYCGRVLSDQQAGMDYATYNMHHHIGNQWKLSHMKHELHADQIQTKVGLKGIFDLDNFKTDSSADDYYATLSEPNTVKFLLKMPHCKAIRKTATWLLWLDLKSLLPKIAFSKSELHVLRLYSLGYTYYEIADRYRNNNGKLHPLNESNISRLLNKLFARISNANHQIIVNRVKPHFKNKKYFEHEE